MDKIEKLAKEIFEEYKGTEDEVTMDEAIEMAKMEVNADSIKNYTTSEKTTRKKVVKEKKVDEDKNFITNVIANALTQNCENVIIENMGKLISFEFNGKPYTVDIKFSRNKYKARVDK